MTERRTSSVSPNISSSSLITPKSEPMENDCIQTHKRRLGEHFSPDKDTNLFNKRQMATKKHQQIDMIQSKFINGRNDSIDESKQTESSVSSNSPKMNNTQKLYLNGGNNDIPSKPR